MHQRAIKSRPRCYSTGDGKRYKNLFHLHSISNKERKVNGRF
nr:MAG TPA: hypothetical protein [Caudoviricetes sp.]